MIFRRPDPIEVATKIKSKPEDRIAEIRLTNLTEKQLLFVSAWTGNLIAPARPAGYSNPMAAADKPRRRPEVVSALQHKQGGRVRESGEQFARTVPSAAQTSSTASGNSLKSRPSAPTTTSAVRSARPRPSNAYSRSTSTR